MLHLLGILTLIGYFLTLTELYIHLKLLRFFKFGKAGFYLSLFFNISLILLAVTSNYSTLYFKEGEGNYFFESHPAIILLLISFSFYLGLNFYKINSRLLEKLLSSVSFAILLIGSVLLHRQGIARIYELSPLLIFHIFVSLISQVFLILVFIFSVLIVVIEKGIKKKTLTSDINNYPPLVPTREIWLKMLYLGLISFLLAISTGLIQVGGITFSYKILLSILCFVGLGVALFAYNYTRISIVRITFTLGLYIFIIFTLQILIRTKIILL